MEFFNALKTEAVLVPAEFIRSHMASASGDYVKVYLRLLQNGSADIEKIAEELMLTEGDVKRALCYWQERGVLSGRQIQERDKMPDRGIPEASETELSGKTVNITERQPAAMEVSGTEKSLRERYRGTESTEILNRLAGDPEFKELMLIVQKYLCKILTEKETQVFAWLYDGLHLPVDVLDYLVAYSVDHDHANIRYIEKLGTDWAEIGIRDVKAARRRTKQFEAGNLPGKNGASAAGSAAAGQASAGGFRGKAAGKAKEAKPVRTDYNELVARELLQNMGD